MIPILLFFLMLLVSIIEIFTLKMSKSKKKIIEIFLLNSMLFLFGFNGIIGFLGNTFFPDPVAKMMGWPSGSPFQFEVGIAGLSFGVLALASLFFRHFFWLATIIGNTIWYWGNVVGHIRNTISVGQSSFGSFFYANLFFPFIVLFFFFLHSKAKHQID